MIDFRIHTFLSVCKYMNFTRAAEELGLTQPAVSQHIRYLENHYQTRLFSYQKKKLQMTASGRFLLDAAATMIHDEIHLQNQMDELQGKEKKLAFGVTLTIGEFVIPQKIAAYLRTHPDTSLKMEVANTQELLRQLNSGNLDFALVEGFFAKREYDSLVYSKEKYIPVCGRGYVPKKPLRYIEDTFEERLLVRETGSGTREIFEKYLESRNYQIHDYKQIAEISNISAIKKLTAGGTGITFLYETAVKEELEMGTLVRIPLEDFHVTHEFTFIWPKNSVFSDYYREMFGLLNF